MWYIPSTFAADPEHPQGHSPAAYLYYQVLCAGAARGCKALSFGISTEDNGKVLNFGLVETYKEKYGRQALNSYAKIFNRRNHMASLRSVS